MHSKGSIEAASHLCVIKTDQRLVCMGQNYHCEIRDECCKDDLSPPTEVRFACE